MTVKCKICGKELKYLNYLHLQMHDITKEEYLKNYPDEDMGVAHGEIRTPESKIDTRTGKRVSCKICDEEFFVLTATHLKKHGLTLAEYKEKFPGVDIGRPMASDNKYIEKVTYENPHEKKDKEFLSLNIKEEGNLKILRPEKSAYVRFRDLKSRTGWTVSQTIHTLVDFYEKYENDEGTKIAIEQMKHASTGLPKDFIPQHRDKLQNILTILEEMAFNEKDPAKLASLTDKIIKINLALPQLEKTDESLVDLKIKEIVEKRKMIFANNLPEFN